jgi:hypothetical protein
MAHMIRDALDDVHQIYQIYRQLRDVPTKVRELFHLVDSVRRNLLNVMALVAKHHFSTPLDEYVDAFRQFRNRLTELELFIDPDQILPRSGPGNDAQHVIHWYGPNLGELQFLEFCDDLQNYLKELEQGCDDLVFRIKRYVSWNALREMVSEIYLSTTNMFLELTLEFVLIYVGWHPMICRTAVKLR